MVQMMGTFESIEKGIVFYNYPINGKKYCCVNKVVYEAEITYDAEKNEGSMKWFVDRVVTDESIINLIIKK